MKTVPHFLEIIRIGNRIQRCVYECIILDVNVIVAFCVAPERDL